MKSQILGNQLDNDDFLNIEELLKFIGNESEGLKNEHFLPVSSFNL